MSRQHGDKARFHRIRKRNAARRLNNRELRAKIAIDAAAAAIALTKPLVIG
jgi:hypothetical protein